VEEVSDISQPSVPHSVARLRFAFLGVSGVNVDFDDETSVLECFQKCELYLTQLKLCCYAEVGVV
jgi:hypothetical protein